MDSLHTCPAGTSLKGFSVPDVGEVAHTNIGFLGSPADGVSSLICGRLSDSCFPFRQSWQRQFSPQGTPACSPNNHSAKSSPNKGKAESLQRHAEAQHKPTILFRKILWALFAPQEYCRVQAIAVNTQGDIQDTRS